MVPVASNSHELVYMIRQSLLGNFATARVDTWRALCAYTKRLSWPRCTILHRTSWCSNKSPSVPSPPLIQQRPTKRSSLQRARALDLSIAIFFFFFLFSKPRIASVRKTGSTGRITTRGRCILIRATTDGGSTSRSMRFPRFLEAPARYEPPSPPPCENRGGRTDSTCVKRTRCGFSHRAGGHEPYLTYLTFFVS